MTVKPRFKSDAFEAIHSAASALHNVGTIDKATMRDFDEASLIETTTLALEEIAQLRKCRSGKYL